MPGVCACAYLTTAKQALAFFCCKPVYLRTKKKQCLYEFILVFLFVDFTNYHDFIIHIIHIIHIHIHIIIIIIIIGKVYEQEYEINS